jgi:hypothetical protein
MRINNVYIVMIKGKCCENKRKRQTMTLVTNKEQMMRVVNKPTYLRMIEIPGRTDLSIAVKRRLSVTLDRPVGTGVAIMDLSKLVMLDFHYDVMKKQYGEKCRLMYTDTGIKFKKVVDRFKIFMICRLPSLPHQNPQHLPRHDANEGQV